MNKIMSLVFVSLFSVPLFSMKEEDNNRKNILPVKIISQIEFNQRLHNSGVTKPFTKPQLDENKAESRKNTPNNRPKKNQPWF